MKFLKYRGGRFYQFTAIDEATRYRVLKVYEHNTTRAAVDFIEELQHRFPVAIQRIQTDHGSEFGTDFSWHLRDLGIPHRYTPRRCPESNGKVERSHRTDAEEFYRRATFRSFAELQTKLRQWEEEYNYFRRISRSRARRHMSGCANSGLRVPRVSGDQLNGYR